MSGRGASWHGQGTPGTSLPAVRVSALWVYPVKGAAGLAVESAPVEPWGLRHDRRWMVVAEDGSPVTAAKARALLRVRVTPDDEAARIRLEAPGQPALAVSTPVDGRSLPVRLSRVDEAVDAGEPAAQWFSAVLGRPVRLVWMADPRRRTVSESHGGRPADRLSLADAGPVLLTSTASLGRLDEWVTATVAEHGGNSPVPLDMRRFRPNVVVDGADEAFVEDGWKRVRVGSVEMRFAEHCDRCVVPTVDPDTLVGGVEPTRTLARHRRWDRHVYFGVRLVPTGAGSIAVGDPVTPL